MAETIVQSGSFTSTGAAVTLNLPTGTNFIRTFNETAFTQATADLAFEFYFQLGMATGQVWTKLGAVANDPVTVGAAVAGSITLVDYNTDPRVIAGTPATTFTGISNATQPVVSSAATNVRVGDIVILSQTATQRAAADATALSGIPFQVVAINSGVSFTISNALQQAPGAGVAAAAGTFSIIRLADFYNPQLRFIANLTSAANAVVTTTVDHGYQIGQEVTFVIPETINGMTQANQLSATVTARTASTFTTDLDTTPFTAFQFPTAAQAAGQQYTPAMVIPAGMDTATALAAVPPANILSDATLNTSLRGVRLAGGATGPAGQNNDVIFWVATKSWE